MSTNSDISTQPIGLKYLWASIFCAVAMVLAGLFKSQQPFVSVSYYLPLHLVLELSSIVVSFAVSASAWYGFQRTKLAREMLVSMTFMAAGMVDFIHTLSYKGMPDFLSINDAGTAAAYWLLARLIVGIGVLLAVYVRGQIKRTWTPILFIVSVISALGLIVVMITRYEPYSGLAFFNDTVGGLTPLKISLEYLVISLYVWAFFALSVNRSWDPRLVVLLRYALILAVFSELAFTLYLNPYGYFNALGHIFKTISYYLVFKALFAYAVITPYEQLAKMNIELQTLYNKSEQQRHEINESIARIGSALSSSLDLDQALKQIADLVAGIFKCECTIVITGKRHNGGIQTMAYSGANRDILLTDKQTVQLCRSSIESLEPKFIDNSVLNELKLSDLQCEGNSRCLVCIPMIVSNRALGVITLYTPDKDFLSADDIELIKVFASHAAVAVHNAISYELESRVAFVLQNAILTSSSVSTDKLEVVHAYKPAVDGTLVGGDFYDLIDLHNGKIAFTVGDVSGKGVEAAVYAAMIKYSLRAHLQTCSSPDELICLLDKTIAGQTESTIFATMFFGMLDIETGRLDYVNAGHNPPIYLQNGGFKSLDPTCAILGAEINQTYKSNSITLENDSLLLLYTDGVSEARRDKELFGSEGIRNKMSALLDQDTQTIVSGILASALEFAGGEQKDDVVIMALRMKK